LSSETYRKYTAWEAGDLLTVVREHVAFKAEFSGKEHRFDCFLYDNEGKNKPINVPLSAVVMALEPPPDPGHLAYVRVIHEGNICVVNSNYVKRYSNQ
jgi:hypothetical protein